MQTVTTQKPKPKIELSYSSLNTHEFCPRRYQLTKLFKHPDYTWNTGLPAVGGSAMHEYLQARCVGKSHVEASVAFFSAFSFEVENNDSDWNKKYRNFEACYQSAIETYETLQIQPEEVAKIQVGDELRNAIECKFNIIISSKDLRYEYHYRGAIDLIKYQSFGNKFTVCDFKTQRSTREADDTVDLSHKHKFDTQLVPYGLIIAFMLRLQAKNYEYNLDQSIIDEIPQFKTTYYSIYVDIINSFVKDYTFTRTKSDVRDWFDNLMRRIINIESYADREVWPRTMKGCDIFMKPCRFHKDCDVADHDVMQDLLLNNHEPAAAHNFGEWLTFRIEV